MCAKGVEECRDCKAKEHPCVCKSLLITAIDQPVDLCKAKVHECLCDYHHQGVYSYDPGHNATGTYSSRNGHSNNAPWRVWWQGAPKICRQHNDDDVIEIDDEFEDVKPAKKTSRRK